MQRSLQTLTSRIHCYHTRGSHFWIESIEKRLNSLYSLNSLDNNLIFHSTVERKLFKKSDVSFDSLYECLEFTLPFDIKEIQNHYKTGKNCAPSVECNLSLSRDSSSKRSDRHICSDVSDNSDTEHSTDEEPEVALEEGNKLVCKSSVGITSELNTL